MDSSLCIGILCVSIPLLFILWIWSIKRLRAQRAEAKFEKRVHDEMRLQARLKAERERDAPQD